LYSAVYLNDYAICASVLVSAGLLLALSFVVRRPFCEGVCPIGAASELLGRVEKRWVLRGQARGSNERL
jgi:polyferredoxin